ncbi:hypothetical protein HK405_006934, partial [Cladochytrium tenue]
AMYALQDIRWLHVVLLAGTPLLAVYGALTTPLTFKTAVFTFIYYFFTGFGITGGYHRYWAHRSYDATRPFQYFLLLLGTGAFEGSVRWWCRDHRAHHRFTDTPKDPYNALYGVFWSHIGWMLVKQDPKAIGRVDISDLNRDPVLRFQHRHYLPLALVAAFLLPAAVAGLGWGDWRGGLFYAGIARLVVVHHATFCVNSLAHFLGDTSFDDRHTPKDHFITALVTLGEGYHNFHHEFPTDYRNAIVWYQYDPTKWLIWLFSLVGLTSSLRTFPQNEIIKGRVQMEQKRLDRVKASLDWGVPLDRLPVKTVAELHADAAASGRLLVFVSGVAYDVSAFIDEHPGGRNFLASAVGKDATDSFNGAVYDHSSAARNLMASMRYAVIKGEISEADKAKPE